MKRPILVVLLCLTLALSLAGCGSGGGVSGKTVQQPAGVNDVLEQGMAEAGGKSGAASGETTQSSDSGGLPGMSADAEPPKAPGAAPEGPAGNIDVDLTILSSTMVYSEVYSMMSYPEEYIGKTVKMEGPFSVYHDEASGNYYFACIIRDATACCAQGIEFVLKDERSYPDDYPEVGAEIRVVGVFDTYLEGGYTYCTLRNAELV